MSIEIISQPPPERKVVAYQHKQNGHVYVLGHSSEGGGVWNALNGLFEPHSYTSECVFNGSGVAQHYTPIYNGDKIVITKEIRL